MGNPGCCVLYGTPAGTVVVVAAAALGLAVATEGVVGQVTEGVVTGIGADSL